MLKRISLIFIATIVLLLIIPGAITLFLGTNVTPSLTSPISATITENPDEGIEVFNPDIIGKNTPKVGAVPFEDYICGVLAAEMGPSFEAEALKAQAVAARTYALRHLGGDMPQSITDDEIAAIQQAYMPLDERKKRWGDGFKANEAKIKSAVDSTKGEIMVYEDEPIEAVFHSTSAGMTEDAADVWDKEYPYLKSVESAEDSAEYISEKAFTNAEVISLLESSIDGLNLTAEPFYKQFHITERSDAGYVLRVKAGDAEVSGVTVRSALGLKSTCFTFSQTGDDVVFVTKGYGHGVGMSQFGARKMAKEGKDYRDILGHYYSGVSILKKD